jgi:hexosaminidase
MSLLLNTLNIMKAIANFFLRFRHISLALLFSVAFLAVSAAGGHIHIIPQPVSVTEKPGDFVLRSGATLVAEGDSLATTAAWFTEQVQALTGVQLRQGRGGKQAIIVRLISGADKVAGQEAMALHPDGYQLSVSPSGIRLSARSPAGIFYGLQTLLQMIPVAQPAAPSAVQSAAIPCADITDYPRFAWRGLMLDVSRHFFTKQEVERYIDDMVRYKYNTLHLHLSDDEGWRIEIKSLPQLTQHGAWRVARTGRWGEFLPALGDEAATAGGFYTQDDMREIIRYAQQRYVTILPEIDIPAHSLALISSYPNLSCTQLPYPVNPGARPPVREDNVLCIGNDSVYMVLDKIFTELAALFPCEYIHIGGDEAYKGFWAACPKCQRRMADEHLGNVEELQSYFVKRIEKMLTAKGKKMIGWDEILEGGLAPEATVMSWRGMAGGIAAARMGHAVVMTPWDYCYLDLYQGESTVEPPTYGMCRLKDSYTYDPVPDSVDERLILGGQGNLWTESVPDFRHVEYMTWPRGLALAEVYWSQKSARNWDSFTGRMEFEFQRMDGAGIKYARSAYNVILTPKRVADNELVVSMSTEVNGLDIYYTFDNTNPDPHYPKYDGSPVKFPLGATQLNVITYRNGHPIGQQVNIKKDELAKRVDEGRHVY